MSFLEALKERAALLKPAQTMVTLPDGSRSLRGPTTIAHLSPTHGFVVDTAPDCSPAQITPYLYLGSQDCCDLSALEQFGIKTVLSVGVPAPNRFNNINYVFVECLDLPESGIRDVLARTNACIRGCVEEGEGGVLVHCNAGVSRSAMVVMGFLIMERGMGFEESWALVKAARPCVKPNQGFIKQLVCLEG